MKKIKWEYSAERKLDEVMNNFTNSDKKKDIGWDVIVNSHYGNEIYMDDFMKLFPKANKKRCEKLIRRFFNENVECGGLL